MVNDFAYAVVADLASRVVLVPAHLLFVERQSTMKSLLRSALRNSVRFGVQMSAFVAFSEAENISTSWQSSAKCFAR